LTKRGSESLAETTRKARQAALVVAAVLAGLAAWHIYRERFVLSQIEAGLAAVLGLTGMLWAAGARGFYKGWMKAAAVLGYVNSRIILSAVFYLIFTPVGIVTRLLGRDPLNRRGKARDSYWIPRKKTRQSPEQFERLF
jgi:hypothetical protein